MGERQAKDALYDAFAEVAKALASGRRAELVDVLAQGERSVEALAHEIDQSVANTSFHLRSLAASGLVATRRDGTRVYYRLASSRVGELWTALTDVATAHHERIDELAEAYLGDRSQLTTLGAGELASRLDRGDVVVVDVRNSTEYEAGHVAGARSIPVAELRERLDELPDDVTVVAYCRGTYCAYADEAVRLLNAEGRRAVRLDAGYPQWRDADGAVETGPDVSSGPDGGPAGSPDDSPDHGPG